MSNTFHYEGRNSKGVAVSGELTANTIEDVITHLKRNDIIPIDIKPLKQSLKLPGVQAFNLDFLGLHKIEPYHIMNFCRELAVLHNAGLSLIKAINKLSLSSSSRSLRFILATISNDISAGMTLSEALKKHPKVFSPLIVNVINIGENTGHLSEILVYLSNYIESSIANRRRLLSAVRYPSFVLITISVSLLLLNLLVIPKFADMFSKFNIELPLATRIIIGTSNFLVNNKLMLLIVVIAIFFGSQRLLKIPQINYLWDKYKLKIPVFGDLQKRIILSQFTWTFSLILRSGIPILKGITLASTSIENTYFNAKLSDMRSAIEHGENLSRAAIASDLFTPMTIQIIEVGEESEKLDEALAEIARYYDAEIDYDLKRLNELIEPILLVIIGGMILILALGIYFPMWDLIKVAN
ncbi:MAG: type II secretion system F family protein [Coxiellaceae bacterium]|jgi:MSHA biogenesis protein MshG|nr:type II secretion system F family protein [Coxiellaceae bacterium]